MESTSILPQAVRQEILDHLHSPKFIDSSPSQVYYTLLDDGTYLASLRSYHRILEANKESRDRRDQLRRPNYKKPELIASAPNVVWSWDITKLKGPRKWEYYHLYVVLDIYSRFVVSWMLAPRESGAFAKQLLEASYERQGIEAGQLTIHSDRGAGMQSKPVVNLLGSVFQQTHQLFFFKIYWC